MRWFRRKKRKSRALTKVEREHYALHKERARTLIHERITYWLTMIPVTPGRIAIKDQRSRWGSCSTKKNLNFNYRLALIPTELADYVIVHELCHLIEFNHSPAFWNEVARVLPDYALRKAALHAHAALLHSAPQTPREALRYLTQPIPSVS